MSQKSGTGAFIIFEKHNWPKVQRWKTEWQWRCIKLGCYKSSWSRRSKNRHSTNNTKRAMQKELDVHNNYNYAKSSKRLNKDWMRVRREKIIWVFQHTFITQMCKHLCRLKGHRAITALEIQPPGTTKAAHTRLIFTQIMTLRSSQRQNMPGEQIPGKVLQSYPQGCALMGVSTQCRQMVCKHSIQKYLAHSL